MRPWHRQRTRERTASLLDEKRLKRLREELLAMRASDAPLVACAEVAREIEASEEAFKLLAKKAN